MPRPTHKRKVHRFIITLTFDKPCGALHALQEARDCIHGLHYTTAYNDGDPETFRVRSIRTRRRGDEALPRRR